MWGRGGASLGPLDVGGQIGTGQEVWQEAQLPRAIVPLREVQMEFANRKAKEVPL